MKLKSLLLFLLTSLSLESIAYYAGDYCEFHGLSDAPDHTTEEDFLLMLGPKDLPNYTVIGDVLAAILLTPIETLKKPNCKISAYAQEILACYQKYKDDIQNKAPEFLELLELIQIHVNAASPQKCLLQRDL